MGKKAAIVTVAILLAVLIAGGLWFSNATKTEPGPSREPASGMPADILAHSEFRFWMREWRTTVPELTNEEFVKSGESPADSYAKNTEGRAPEAPELRPPTSHRYFFSPSRARFIDLFAHFGEPDSSVTVYDRDGGKRLETLAFCGTPCRFNHGFWLDDDQVVVLGVSESSTPDQEQLTVDLYDLGKNVKTSFGSSPHRFAEDPFRQRLAERWLASLSPEEAEHWKFLGKPPTVIVDTPKPGADVGALLHITGFSRTFENTVNIRIRNTRTLRVHETFTTADAPDTGFFGTFSARMDLPTLVTDLRAGDALMLEVFEYSAMDGSEVGKVSVPIAYWP